MWYATKYRENFSTYSMFCLQLDVAGKHWDMKRRCRGKLLRAWDLCKLPPSWICFEFIWELWAYVTQMCILREIYYGSEPQGRGVDVRGHCHTHAYATQLAKQNKL